MELKLLKATSPIKLAVVDAIDRSSSRRISRKNPCKRGCYSCCYRIIKITLAEAIIIYSYLIENKKWGDVRQKCIEQLPISKDIDPIAWFKMKIECPVLDTNKKECSAYRVRPPVCSTHFVKSKSQVCHPWYVGKENYEEDHDEISYNAAIKRIEAATEENGVLGIELSIQTGLLLAEKVSVKTGLDYDRIIRIIANEF